MIVISLQIYVSGAQADETKEKRTLIITSQLIIIILKYVLAYRNEMLISLK